MIEHEINQKNEDYLKVITLVKEPDGTKARVLNGNKALELRKQFGLEFRV